MMKSDFPMEDTIRQYLLGQLNDQSDLEMRLSQQMLSDDELSETVDSIEDEIIEEYLDGTVSAEDKEAIEKYFLAPAERKEKLLLASLLREHFAVATGALEKKKLDVPRVSAAAMGDKSAQPSPGQRPVQIRTWYEVAAAVLVIAGFIYIFGLRHGLQSQLQASRESESWLKSELARERDRSANLTKQLQEARPPIAILTFIGPVFRADDSAHVVDIKPWTQGIRVEIDLQNAPSGDYDVQLKNREGKPVWSQSRITASFGNLRFEIPAHGLPTGAYCLFVSSRPNPYCFHARASKN
jgi:hypothetical protein